ncbi:MAG: terminase B [Spirochaetia bacterium]|nr:terminase B [Spirochaetia bacterium]
MQAIADKPATLPIEAIHHYLDHPIDYVRDIIGAEPTDQQREVLSILPQENAIAIRSGHGIGKTALEAWALLWFLPLHPYARIPCTAPTGHQLEDILWPEVHYWLTRSKALKDVLEWTKTRLAVKGAEETWFAVPRSANKPENLQGFHGKHIMFMVDEASGVPQDIMEVIEGALTSGGAKLLMAGNPTQLSGTFFDAFHKDRRLYSTFTFSSIDSPNVSEAYPKRVGEKYGVNSDVYRVRVQGLFPRGEPDTFIRLDHAEAAIGREVKQGGPIVIGVDPARFGDDESVVCPRRGKQILPLQGFHNVDGGTLASHVIKIVSSLRDEHEYNEPIEVRVDETGIGASAVDFLKRMAKKRNLIIVPINFGAAGDKDYKDFGSKIWGEIRDALMEVSLPDDQDLTAQLVTRKYKLELDGRIKLERKEDMKKRGISSPDRADALGLATVDLSDRTFRIEDVSGSMDEKIPGIEDSIIDDTIEIMEDL